MASGQWQGMPLLLVIAVLLLWQHPMVSAAAATAELADKELCGVRTRMRQRAPAGSNRCRMSELATETECAHAAVRCCQSDVD